MKLSNVFIGISCIGKSIREKPTLWISATNTNISFYCSIAGKIKNVKLMCVFIIVVPGLINLPWYRHCRLDDLQGCHRYSFPQWDHSCPHTPQTHPKKIQDMLKDHHHANKYMHCETSRGHLGIYTISSLMKWGLYSYHWLMTPYPETVHSIDCSKKIGSLPLLQWLYY